MRPGISPAGRILPDQVQERVAAHRTGPLRVLAGPGTGKTTTLVEAAVRRIAEGADPSSVLVLTFGRRAASDLRDRISLRAGRTLREPLARSFPSFAFGLLRRMASVRGWERPRLLSGPEQDMVIRELLEGDLEDDPARWPRRLHEALHTNGVAGEMRDLLMRCAERGVSAARLREWGERYGRDDWVAGARFMTQYAGVTGFQEGGAYDPAEVIRAVLDGLRADPELLREESERLEWIYVDEYHDVDPAQAELLNLVSGHARAVVVAGDPDQSVYAFRGSDSAPLRDFPLEFLRPDGEPAPTIMLTGCRRGGPALLGAFARINSRFSGSPAHRQLVPAAPPGQLDRVEVHLLRTAAQEASFIAHRLRESHLIDGVPWSEMAVVVRSAARTLPALRRAFLAAGVPLAVAGDEVPLVHQPAVSGLLDILRVAVRPDTLDEDAALALVCSPYVGADPLALRRARQELRRVELAGGGGRSSARLIRDALADPRELILPDSDAVRPVRHAAALLRAATEAIERGGTAEDVLWDVWAASEVAPRWRATSLVGGARGAAADADLDAVVALFEAAGRFVDRMPGAAPAQLLEHLRGQEIPGDSFAAQAPMGQAVRVVTAHMAKGSEWSVVVVAGVQEGLWPDLRPRGSLLGSEAIVDLAAGRDPATLSRTAQMLDEERRLFYVAITRARHHLIVTAVESQDAQPSRFLDELSPYDADKTRPHSVFQRALTLGDVTAQLRATLMSLDSSPVVRRAAAGHLAALADEGVPGAAPIEWYGLMPLTDESPLRAAGELVPVSPSRVEQFDTCELRWLLEQSGGTSGIGPQQGLGSLVHDAAAALITDDLSEAELDARIDAGWSGLDLGARWFGAKERERVRRMTRRLMSWLAANPRRLEGVELAFETRVGRAIVRGRVDRLERDGEGRFVPVDLKTTKSPGSRAEAEQNPQLGVYQLAITEGAFGTDAEAGGAELVHLGKEAKSTIVHPQPPLSDAADPTWARELVLRVAEGMAGSAFTAVANQRCQICPARTSCPIQREGKQVTET